MMTNKWFHNRNKHALSLGLPLLASLSLFGCGSSSDDDGTGYMQLYNLSSNSPGINLVVDQYDDDDYDDKTYAAIDFLGLSSRLSYDADTYDISLAWQDEYDNVDDLEVVYEGELKVKTDYVELIVIAEDIKSPSVYVYDIPIRDDDEIEDDDDDDLFNLRVLNMHTWSEGVDVYYSESDETFNEATLLNQTNYTELADNQKIDQDEYVFYLTSAGESEVLYESSSISFSYAAEYTMVIRENQGVGSSPFILDRLATSSRTEYPDTNSEAQYRVYNGIVEHELLPEYQGSFDFHIDGIDDSAEVDALAYRGFSSEILTEAGDYSMSLVDTSSEDIIINNHLLALSENSDKTIFFYLLEEAVDEDGDGDIDENGDGTIDEKEITINSLVVDNSQSDSIYSHQIKVINLIDQDEIIDDFSAINVYFVKNDEIIETVDQSLTAKFASPTFVTLLNNTYTLYIIGKLDTSDIVLSTYELVLDEDSSDQFLILEKDSSSSTGYRITLAPQNAETED